MSAEQKELFCAACGKATAHVVVDRRKVRWMTWWFVVSWAVMYFAIGLGVGRLRDLSLPHFYERSSRGIWFLVTLSLIVVACAVPLLVLRLLLGRQRWMLGFPLKPRVWRCEVCGRVRWEDKKRKPSRES
jgi:hypothetical protein